MIPVLLEQQKASFWEKVRKAGPNDCWIWTAGKCNGYGWWRISDQGQYYAHIIAYYLTVGAWPSGRKVMHSCDNPVCCNPNHLSDGSDLDNSLDCIAKGRANRGNGNHAHVSEVEVEEIKRLGLFFGPREISNMSQFKNKITESAIGRILNGKTWRHVR